MEDRMSAIIGSGSCYREQEKKKACPASLSYVCDVVEIPEKNKKQK